MRALPSLAIQATTVLAALLPARAARALDPFEIQVYDGTADAAGAAGVEAHVNGVVDGLRAAPPPEVPPNHTVHFTLEPSYGVRAYWELGAYLQTALRPDGSYDFAGVKLRSKLVTPSGWRPSLRLGINTEVSYLPARYEADRWGGELRPIVAWENHRFLFAFNPILDISLTGGIPSFEPAAMAVMKIRDELSLGLEYYAGFGPLDAPAALHDQQQILYQVVNLLAVRGLEVNLGVGEGLTPASNGLTVKAIVGYGLDWFARPAHIPPAPPPGPEVSGARLRRRRRVVGRRYARRMAMATRAISLQRFRRSRALRAPAPMPVRARVEPWLPSGH